MSFPKKQHLLRSAFILANPGEHNECQVVKKQVDLCDCQSDYYLYRDMTIGSYIRMKSQIEAGLANEVRGVAAGYDAILGNWIQVNTSMVASLANAVGNVQT